MINTEILNLKIDDVMSNKLINKNTNCLICGKHITSAINKKDVLSSNFTNLSECKCLNSEYICLECSNVLKSGVLRKNNFIADRYNLYLLKKNDLELFLFNLNDKIKGEFVIGITRSFKKHNSFRCRVNSNPYKFYIREEDREYLFDVKENKKIYTILNEMYLYFSKEELEYGNYKYNNISQYGKYKFIEHENILKTNRGSFSFDLMIYMLNSERRNEIVKERLKKKRRKNNE